MTESADLLTSSALASILAAPALVVALLGVARWATGRRASERFVSRAVGFAFAWAMCASAALLVASVLEGHPGFEADLGAWFALGGYRFRWILVGDRLALVFALFASVLLWTIAAFSRRYLHREEGFHRFYLMLSFFGLGVLLVVVAGSLDLVFFGWEIVGLTSALLIAFFHERREPVENGLRTFVTYRFCDIGLLAAAVWLHHVVGDSSIRVHEAGAWAALPIPPDPRDVLAVGFLAIWATIGKAAQLPLGGWLPRAMEGPTPSSAIFYGAISVHLGPYLLLRASPLLDASGVLAGTVIAIGATTALHATFVGRVQTDIKSVLAYASMAQIGIIYVEIGLGWNTIALIHIVGHATLRSLQILRSPSLLHDHHKLEQALGTALPRSGGHLEVLVPRRLQPWLYRAALERGYLDALIVDHLVGRLRAAVLALDGLEQRWAGWIAGDAGESDALDSARETEGVAR